MKKVIENNFCLNGQFRRYNQNKDMTVGLIPKCEGKCCRVFNSSCTAVIVLYC